MSIKNGILILIFSIICSLFLFSGVAMQKIEGTTKEKIKILKKEMYTSLDQGDEARASIIKQLINDIKDGKEVTEFPSREKQTTGPSKEDLEALDNKEVKKIERMINKKDGEALREELNEEQQNEYNARRLLLDGKKGMIKGDFEFSRNALGEAHKLKPKDDEIEHYYRLCQFPEFTVSSKKKIVSLKKDKKVILNFNNTKNSEGYKAEEWTKGWELKIIRNRRNETVRRFKGENLPPSEIIWDGKDKKGLICRDGEYHTRLLIKGDYYTKTTAADYSFELKAKPPTVQLQVEKETFIASDEGVEITISCENPDDITEWTIVIINQVGELVKKIEGTKIKEVVSWDGKDLNGVPVNEGETLIFKMSGKDTLGKAWDSNEDSILSDIKIVDNKITLNNIRFESGKAKLKKQSLPILDKVINLLGRFPYYDIIVIGHTDSVGKAAYNLGLSKRRAASVKMYLQKKGITANRLSSDGKGETEPIASNDTEEGKARNRRVEFLLNENAKKKEIYYENKRKEMIEKAKTK